MPNYVTNRLIMIGDKKKVDEVKDSMRSDASVFDFNRVIPEPDDLHERPDIGTEPAWYIWRMEHWGVKWNAMEAVLKPDNGYEVWFLTAWDGVGETVIRALSERFPDVRFEYAWADEDVAYNCGEMVFTGGKMAAANVPEGGSREALDIYMMLHPESVGCYAYIDGTVVYTGNELLF